MAGLDKETLENLAKLCRVECSEKVLAKLLKNLKAILSYMDIIKEVDTTGVATCNHVLETVNNVTREDHVKETLNREIFLANSPSHIGGMIRVPPVIKF